MAGSFIDFLADHLPVLKDKPPMGSVLVNTTNPQQCQFTISTNCPHCHHDAVFLMVTNPHKEPFQVGGVSWMRVCAATQCQGCGKYVLAVVLRRENQPFTCEDYYPVTTPDETIGEGVPEQIGDDLKEAIRCEAVHAFKATVCMCRRALEASCDNLGASGRKLYQKIDSLVDAGKITPLLRDVATQIRLVGNRGAHPREESSEDQVDPLANPKVKDADAVITFMREYLHHVYTVPHKLKKFSEAETPPSGG
jgi:hypothetical protein